MAFIKIVEKIRPFSHLPGTCLLIPFTHWQLQAFPSLLRINDLYSEEVQEIALPVEGPVSGFTVELDLEKGDILIFGKGQNGFFSYKIYKQADVLLLSSKKEKTKQVLLPSVVGLSPFQAPAGLADGFGRAFLDRPTGGSPPD